MPPVNNGNHFYNCQFIIGGPGGSGPGTGSLNPSPPVETMPKPLAIKEQPPKLNKGNSSIGDIEGVKNDGSIKDISKLK